MYKPVCIPCISVSTFIPERSIERKSLHYSSVIYTYILAMCMMSVKSKASLRSPSQLPKVSTRLGLVWLESHLGSGSFFSENESLGSASKSSASFTSLVHTLLCTIISWYTSDVYDAEILMPSLDFWLMMPSRDFHFRKKKTSPSRDETLAKRARAELRL